MPSCPHCQNIRGFAFGTCTNCGWNHQTHEFDWILINPQYLPKDSRKALVELHSDRTRVRREVRVYTKDDTFEGFSELGQKLLKYVHTVGLLPKKDYSLPRTSNANQAGLLWERWWWWTPTEGYCSMSCHSSQIAKYETAESFVIDFTEDALQYQYRIPDISKFLLPISPQ
jgi:hypothetical protein